MSISLSQLVKIQTNKIACRPTRLRATCELVHADSTDCGRPNCGNIQSDLSLGWLFMFYAVANYHITLSKLEYLKSNHSLFLSVQVQWQHEVQ